jgi:DNA-binding beta-propeller fold protein YncE
MKKPNIIMRKETLLWLALCLATTWSFCQTGSIPAFEPIFSISSESEGNVFLDQPQDAAVDTDGNVYLIDQDQNRIIKIDRNGNYLLQWGVPGTGNGAFDSPRSIAIGSDNHIYVLDAGNFRVQKFDTEGTFILAFGSMGTGNGQFLEPLAIAADPNGSVYVSEGNLGARIQRFDLKGGFISKFGTSTTIGGNLTSPTGVAIADNGNLLVADGPQASILEFNTNGELVRMISSYQQEGLPANPFVNPVDVVVDNNGRIFILDIFEGAHRLISLSKDLIFNAIYFVNGGGAFSFGQPTGLGVDTLGGNRIYLTDAGRGKLIRFTSGLSAINEIGTDELDGLGQLGCPAGVALSSGLIYISDPANEEIKTYRTTDFGFTGISLRGATNGPGQLIDPGPLGVSSMGEVFVIDGRTSVKKFRPDGTFADSTTASINQVFNGIHVDPNGTHLVTRVTQGENELTGFREFESDFSLARTSSTFDFLAPYGITRDRNGFVYVTDTTSNSVKVYNPANNYGFRLSFDAPGVPPMSFGKPLSLAIDHRGNILVADTDNHRILKFNSQGEFIATYGTYGSLPGEFFHPIDIKVDGTGRVFVADKGNRRVQVLRTCQIIDIEERTICAGESTVFEGTTYDQTGQYDRVFVSENGCDSIRRLDLTVLAPIRTEMSTTICAGESISFFGTTLDATGLYQNKLTAENGCDSIITMDLTVADTFRVETTQTICKGDTYFFGNIPIDMAGNYQQTFTSTLGCDSTVLLTLMLADTVKTDLTDTICLGDTLRVGDRIFTQSTTDRVIFPATEERCDSVVHVQLTVLDTLRTSRTDTICLGDTLVVGDNELFTSGIHEVVFPPTDTRCDSTVEVHLTVLDTFRTVRFDTICHGDTLEIGNFDLSRSDTYELVFPPTDTRCDSTVEVHLTVLDTFRTGRTDTICQGESLVVNGQVFSVSGEYSVTFPPTDLRCDSTVDISLTVLDTFRTVRTDTICQGDQLVINGQALTSTGVHEVIFPPTDNRCDSTVVVNLTVLPTFRTERFDTICANEEVTIGNETFNQTGMYQIVFPPEDNRCDSTVVLNLTVRTSYEIREEVTICEGETFTIGNQSLSTSGQITISGQTQAGCDSNIIYDVRVLPKYDLQLDTALCVGEQLHVGNTTFSSPGTFTYTFPATEARCDSTLEITLTYKDTFNVRTEQTICTGEVYVLGDRRLTDPGVYTYTFPENDQRCDSTVTLDLNVLETAFDTLDLQLCPGDVLFFGSTRVDGPGHYDARLTARNGCDSLVHIRVSPRAPKRTSVEARVCENDGYFFGGDILRQSGIYQDTLQSSNGCDSIITLDLRVDATLVSRTVDTICAGETYTFSGDRIRESGLYRDSFLAQTGCYFYLELELTVLPNYSDTTYAKICAGQSFTFENEVYTQTGLYQHRFQAEGSCDSIRYLNLTVTEPSNRISEATICRGDTFYFQERMLTRAGVYRDTMTTEAGCDSILSLFLDVQEPTFDTVDVNLCGEQSYEFAGQFIDSSGLYSDTLTNRNGCDSVVTVRVSFQDAPEDLVTVGGILMTANIENARYQWVNCRDTMPIPNATSQFFIPEVNGMYAVIIQTDECIYFSECFQMNVGMSTSTSEPDISDQINLYPNPATEVLRLDWMGRAGQWFDWQITSAAGQRIDQGRDRIDTQHRFDIRYLPAGLYWLTMRNEDGQLARLRFVRAER